MTPILHICTRAAWAAAGPEFYTHPSLKSEGFIHCSAPSQLLGSAEKFFAGQEGLVVLVLDPEKLASPLRHEPASNGELFAHIFGPINISAVTKVLPLERDSAGAFLLPPGV